MSYTRPLIQSKSSNPFGAIALRIALATHESLMVPELSLGERQLVLGIAALKACVVSRLESSPAMLTFFHRYVEKYAGIIIKNQ